MNKLSLILLLLLSATIRSQEILPYFLSMPEEITPYLNTAQRKNMVDLYHAKQTPTVGNKFGSASTLKQLNDHRLLIQLSDRSTFEMCTLPFEKKEVKIITIETFEIGKRPYSLLKCYSGQWKLDEQIGVLPRPMTAERFQNFFPIRSKQRYEHLSAYSVRYRLDEEKEAILEETIFEFTTDSPRRNDTISILKPLNLKAEKR